MAWVLVVHGPSPSAQPHLPSAGSQTALRHCALLLQVSVGLLPHLPSALQRPERHSKPEVQPGEVEVALCVCGRHWCVFVEQYQVAGQSLWVRQPPMQVPEALQT